MFRRSKVLKGFLLVALSALVVFGAVGCSGSSEETAGDGDAKGEQLIVGVDAEFSVRPDGLPGLEETYGFSFPAGNVKTMDLGITYKALRDGEVDIAMGFATDGRIKAFELVNLEDDKQFFPVYNPAPVVRKEVMEQYPEIADVLKKISAKLDTETMTNLNYQVDIEEKEPVDVAREWLEAEGLIGNGEKGDKGPIKVGSKEFTEQLILGQITNLALEDAGFAVEDKTNIAGSTKVRAALENGDFDLYWEYTGTAWLVHLQHEDAITDPQEAYEKVKAEDAENGFVWLDYAPFNNTYTLMMRQNQAEELNIKSLSNLAAYVNNK